MRKQYSRPELLAPAGSILALYAAVEAGADAVYVGGKRYGARMFASNFCDEEMAEAVRYCHMHGVRLYVTVNTLIYDREMDEAVAYCRWLHSIGADALIVCDIGLIRRLRKELPELELHASTQMSVHNTSGADFADSLGLHRVVLARECSGEDIESIIDFGGAECEVFIHGALCVCHSGQCLFSAMVGGRSGNRGMCAQPCRLPYNGKALLSLKDLSLGAHMRELMASGVSSLKIEGRMKSPDYVYTVVSIYRRLIDENRDATEAEMHELAEVFSRGGFTDGYYTGKIAFGMTGVRTDEDKNRTKSRIEREFLPAKLKVRGHCEIKRGREARLSLSLEISDRMARRSKTVSVSVSGAVPTDALSSPLTAESVRARLAKLGNTPFALADGDIALELDEGLNLSPGAVNALRRDAAAALLDTVKLPLSVQFPHHRSSASNWFLRRDAALSDGLSGRLTTAMFHRFDTLDGLNRTAPESLRGIDVAFIPLEAVEECSCESFKTVKLGIAMPPVIMESELKRVNELLAIAERRGIRYALVSNIGHFGMLSIYKNFLLCGDFRLNIANAEARAAFAEFGLGAALLSPELTLPMARDAGGGTVVLGRMPLMLTERCFIKENFGCESCTSAALSDRTGARFPIIREFGHRNLIMNSTLTYMGDRQSELDKYRILHRHFIFSCEPASEAEGLLDMYFGAKPSKFPVRRVGMRESGLADK